MSQEIKSSQEPKEKKFPIVTVGEIIHLVQDGFCVASIVSGIPENYEEVGALIAHMFLPMPNTPAICAPGMPQYQIPTINTLSPTPCMSNNTWHKCSDCLGIKRIPSAPRSRLVAPVGLKL